MFLRIKDSLYNTNSISQIRMGFPLHGNWQQGATEVFLQLTDGKQVSLEVFDNKKDAVIFLDDVQKKLLTNKEVVIL